MGYTKGLHEVADGVWAYLQPDGGWGWSNAGLITGDDGSLLVDTLFDLRLTAEMLEQMRATTPAADRIATVVNTHANGDHCYGNALLEGSEIIATARCAEEMLQLPPATMAAMLRSADSLGAAGQFVQRIFSPFSFEDVPLAVPTRTFERPARPAGRRPHGLAARSRPGPHGRRRRRLTAGRRHRLHRGHPLPRRPPHRLVRSGGQLDRGL